MIFNLLYSDPFKDLVTQFYRQRFWSVKTWRHHYVWISHITIMPEYRTSPPHSRNQNVCVLQKEKKKTLKNTIRLTAHMYLVSVFSWRLPIISVYTHSWGWVGGCTLMTALLLHCPPLCTDHPTLLHSALVHSDAQCRAHSEAKQYITLCAVAHSAQWDELHTLCRWFFRLMLLGHTTPILRSCWPQNIHKLKSFWLSQPGSQMLMLMEIDWATL